MTLVSSYSARIIAAFQQGLQDVAHDTLEIAWVTRGRIGGRVGGEHQPIDPDHFGIVTPGTVHSSWTLDEEVAGHVLHLFAPAAALSLASGVYPLEGRVRAILAGFPAPTAPRSELERGAQELLAELQTRCAPAGAPADPRLKRVIWSLASDPTGPVTLDDLARRAHMSRHHFARAFRSALGVSPMSYVRRLRVERAAVLLRSTDQSVARIAFESGFGSAGRLSEAFRACFGLAPSEWRERQRAEQLRQSSG